MRHDVPLLNLCCVGAAQDEIYVSESRRSLKLAFTGKPLLLQIHQARQDSPSSGWPAWKLLLLLLCLPVLIGTRIRISRAKDEDGLAKYSDNQCKPSIAPVSNGERC
jgi:hypothetical protein